MVIVFVSFRDLVVASCVAILKLKVVCDGCIPKKELGCVGLTKCKCMILYFNNSGRSLHELIFLLHQFGPKF
jgi:hypothetical protein